MSLIFSTNWKFKLGEKVKDRVTGFKGTITSRIEYLNGCLQYCVEPKVGKEGKKMDYQYVDEGQLELIEGKSKRVSKSGPQGVMPNTPD